MTTSADPNQTRGRAASIQTSLAFPLEVLPIGTRLKFLSYSRFDPDVLATERTTTLISLPIPSSVPDRTGIKTGTTDLNGWGAIDTNKIIQRLEHTDSLRDAWEQGKSIIGDDLKRMKDTFKISALKGLALNPLMPDDVKQRLGLLAGVIQNPHTNMIFEGVELRTYNLSWKVSPRSQEESDALQSIIDTIKLRIHPEESLARYALDYPDTVDVTFTGDAAKYLPKINRAMVRDFQVTSGDGGQIPMFKSGAPILIDINMNIQEVNIVTRNKLRGDPVGGSTEVVT